MFASVSLVDPSSFGSIAIIRIGGSVDAIVKKLNGARLRLPSKSFVETHATGRGTIDQDISPKIWSLWVTPISTKVDSGSLALDVIVDTRRDASHAVGRCEV